MRRPQLRSTFARAVVPVLGGLGFFALLGLALWGVAALISGNGEATTNLSKDFQEMGNADYVAGVIDRSGPILMQDLVGNDLHIVLDHQAATGFQIYLAHPADRDATCVVEQVRGTRQFTDCDGRTIDVGRLALPPAGVVPIVGKDGGLTLKLTADS